MKKICLITLLLLFVGPLSADTKGDITAAMDYFAEIWNEGDMEAIRGYYHSDFMLMTLTGPINLQQRLDDLAAIAEEGKDRGELELSQLTIRELDEKFAMAYGFRKLSFKDGSALDGWFTTIFEKTPFGWKALLTQD
jgi:ketosteroid isomerase-like protein